MHAFLASYNTFLNTFAHFISFNNFLPRFFISHFYMAEENL